MFLRARVVPRGTPEGVIQVVGPANSTYMSINKGIDSNTWAGLFESRLMLTQD